MAFHQSINRDSGQLDFAASVGFGLAHTGEGHYPLADRHIAVGDVGNDNLIIIGHIIDVEAVGIQAHIGGSDIRPGNRCRNGFFQGDGDTGGERIATEGEVGSIYRIGRSLVDTLAAGTGDGHIYNRLRRKVGGVGIRDVDAIGILAGSEAGIGADHITLAVRPVDEVVVIIRRRGGAGGRAGGRCHSLGSQTYGTAFTSNIVNGHRGVFRVSNGNRRVRRGHRSGHHGLVSGVAGDHGGVYAVGGIIGDLLVYIRIRSSGAIFVNIVDGELKVGLFPVGNERQVAGGAGGDFKTQLSFLAAAGGAFAHGPAQELIAFPDRVNQGKAWRADIVIGGVGVGAAGPSGLIRAAVIQIIGNVELLQLQLEDNYVLGVVGGKDGGLGIDAVLQLIAIPQELLRLIRGYIHGELLGCGFDHVSVENHFIAVTELDPIGEVAQRSVGEDDLILHTTGQGEGFLRGVNNVVRVRAGGCDRLGNYPGADCACAGDGRADFLAVSGHILDGVVNVPALINLGIDGGILGQRLVKVKGGGEFRILVPADEIIAGKQIRLHKIRGSVIGNGNGSQGAVRILVLHLHNEIQADGRRLELGVEGQVVAGHGGKGVGIAQAIGVVIPALEFIPGIQIRGSFGGIVVGVFVDVRAVEDTGFRFQGCAIVDVGDCMCISAIVEAVDINLVLTSSFVSAAGVTVGCLAQICKAEDFFCAQIACGVIFLRIIFALFILTAINGLQPVLNLILRKAAFPHSRICYRRSTTNGGSINHIGSNFKPFGNIVIGAVIGIPSIESVPCTSSIESMLRGGPLGGNILAQNNRKLIIASTILLSALGHLNVAVIRVNIEDKGIPGQRIVDIDNRGAVRFHHSAGIFSISRRIIARTRPDAGGGNVRTHSAGAGRSVSIGVVGRTLAAVIPDLFHCNDGVARFLGSPLGIDSGIRSQNHCGAGRLGAVRIQIPAVKGIALTGGGGGNFSRCGIAAVVNSMDVLSLAAGKAPAVFPVAADQPGTYPVRHALVATDSLIPIVPGSSFAGHFRMGMRFPVAGQLGAGRTGVNRHFLLVHPGLRGDVGAALGVVGQLVGIPVILNGNNRFLGLQGNLVKGLGLEVGHFLGGGLSHLAVGTCHGLVGICGVGDIGTIQRLEPVLNRVVHGSRREGDGDRDIPLGIIQRQGVGAVGGNVALVGRGGIVRGNVDFRGKGGFAIGAKGKDLHDGGLDGHAVLHHIQGDPNLTGREDGHILKGAHIFGIGGRTGGTGLHHGTVAVRHRVAQNRVATAGGGIGKGDGLGLRQHDTLPAVSVSGGVQLAVHKGGGGNGGGNALIGEPAIALHIQRVGQVDGVLDSLGGSLLGGSILGGSILGGSFLGGCGGHGDLPDLFLVADRIGDGGKAFGYTENLGNVLFAGVSFFRPDSGNTDIVAGPGAAGLRGRGQGDGLANRYAAVIGILFLRLLSGGILSLGFLSLGFLSLGGLSLGFLSLGGLSLGLLSLGLLNCGFLSLGLLNCGFLSLGFLDLGFLSSRLHDGRLRLGDYRGGGAEREGVGGA